MAPKDLNYNVPDVIRGNDVGIQDDQIEIEYPAPAAVSAPFDFDQEVDDIISLQLTLLGK